MSGAREHRFSAWTRGIGPLDPTLSALLKQRSNAFGLPHAALPVFGPAAPPTAADAGAGPSAAAPKAKLHLTRAVLRTMSDAGDSAYLGSEAPDSPHPPLSASSGPPPQAGSGPSESGRSSVCVPEADAPRTEAEAAPDSPRSWTSHPHPEEELDNTPEGAAAEAAHAAFAWAPPERAAPRGRALGDACWLLQESGLLALAVAELLLVLVAAAVAIAGGGAARTRFVGALMLVPIQAGRGAVRLAAALLAALFQIAGSLAGVALALQGIAADPATAHEPSRR